MTDVTMGWGLAVACILGLVVLVVVAVRQIIQRYSSDKVVMVAWIAVAVLYPVGGAASWFLWESWLRDAVRNHRGGWLHGYVTRRSHAASATAVFMMVSNWMGVKRPRGA